MLPWSSNFLTDRSIVSFLQIDWEYRKDNAQTNCKVFVSIDGTDFRIQEPSPFSSSWYSHKFKGPGVLYGNNVTKTK